MKESSTTVTPTGDEGIFYDRNSNRWWTSRGCLNFFSERFWRDSSLPLVSNVCSTARKLGLYITLWWDWRFNASSDGDGDLPQVNLQLRDFLKSWLDCPRFTGLWKICWNLDWTVPGLLDNTTPSPLLLIGDFCNGSVITLEVILFTKRAFVHRIFTVWISSLSNK